MDRFAFHILSFEGPDSYARAGGIATRISGLAREFIELFSRLRRDPDTERKLRRHGMRTARHYAWPRVVERALMPRI